MKKGVFFSMDALIALLIIFLFILGTYPFIKYSKSKSELQYDVISTFSSLKIGKINNSYVKSLISQGIISNTNKSILEQIGEFYVTNITLAKSLADSVLSNLTTQKNIGIWYGSTLISSKNTTSFESAKNIDTARQVVSGIKEGESITGFSGRAYLGNSLQSKYFYFGGYLGDGNITVLMDYQGNINSAEIELAINNNFSVYVNGNFAGNFSKSTDEFSPVKYSLPAVNFISGSNQIEFKGNNLHTTGGFIKIIYESSAQYKQPDRYSFPGVKGIINIYDGFYVPGQLTSLNIFLHYNSAYKTFLNIGNVTLFEENGTGETTTNLSNSYLSSLLNYNILSNKTIPIRFGLKEIVQQELGGDYDIILVTDFSGSMKKSVSDNSDQGNANIDCNNVSANPNARKGELAKCLDKIFVDLVLNNTNNKLWPVYIQGGQVTYYDNPTNAQAIKNDIDSKPQGNGFTCLSCAINLGYNILKNNTNVSQPQRKKAIILMTDGVPTHCASGSCLSNLTNYGTQYCQGYCDSQGQGQACQFEGCSDGKCSNPINNTLYSANRTRIEQNTTIYTIGFGLVETCNEASVLLQKIANLTGGKYYHSADVNELEVIYRSITKQFVTLTYQEQIANATGNVSSTLYPDSYIEFNYTKDKPPYGLIITAENQFTNQNSGFFSIPTGSKIVETRVTSYSGPRWTVFVDINNATVYNLSAYAQEFTKLGDPFVLNLPNSIVTKDNIIKVSTGVSPNNLSSGSIFNKIIYTIAKNISSYSPIVSSAQGCNWEIEFEDSLNITMKIPSSYQGAEICYYEENRQQYNANDAIQTAVYNLLKQIDLNLNNKIDLKFTEQNLQISASEITGIPFTWSTEVQVRIWS